MKTNLAYINDVMDRAIEGEFATPVIPESDRAKATQGARKVIGGFRVHDGAAEQKALDEMIAKRRAAVEKFRNDRAAVRDKLAGMGVIPLAVCPTGAWYKLCRDAGLFVLSPDKNAMVGISQKAFDDYTEKKIDQQVAENWAAYLNRLFPEGRSLASSNLKATLILPDPPADVADILCKAQSLTLTVAAVGEAIKFVEKPSELSKKAKTNPKDLWAQQQGYADYADWLKRDPIIFTEHETAAAIIAQFGDFPIEQKTVDAVIATGSLISEKPKDRAEEAASRASYVSPIDLYAQEMERMWQSDELRRHRAEFERARYEAMRAQAAAQAPWVAAGTGLRR